MSDSDECGGATEIRGSGNNTDGKGREDRIDVDDDNDGVTPRTKTRPPSFAALITPCTNDGDPTNDDTDFDQGRTTSTMIRW